MPPFMAGGVTRLPAKFIFVKRDDFHGPEHGLPFLASEGILLLLNSGLSDFFKALCYTCGRLHRNTAFLAVLTGVNQ
jgi:hypothetical protein